MYFKGDTHISILVGKDYNWLCGCTCTYTCTGMLYIYRCNSMQFVWIQGPVWDRCCVVFVYNNFLLLVDILVMVVAEGRMTSYYILSFPGPNLQYLLIILVCCQYVVYNSECNIYRNYISCIGGAMYYILYLIIIMWGRGFHWLVGCVTVHQPSIHRRYFMMRWALMRCVY